MILLYYQTTYKIIVIFYFWLYTEEKTLLPLIYRKSQGPGKINSLPQNTILGNIDNLQ